VEGYNGTVFAYGQTGCGKSFSMQGIEEPATQRGIIPRAFEHIFESITVADNSRFLVHASYLEIYNEDIRDLLSKSTKVEKLEVKEHPDKGVYVKDLSKIACNSISDMEKLMDRGSKNRSVGATLMNADSSRSHSIFTIFIETSEKGADGEEHIKAGKLNLVDLAGSERQAKTGATGGRLKEATKINLSLSALGNVISALVDGKSKHIPYRDSKLTRLLQDSLGGNTKTLMVACISPADNNFDETLSTLRYANRAKNIKNKPKINEDPKDALLREYQDEITMLKQLLTGKIPMDPQMLAKFGLDASNVVQPSSTTPTQQLSATAIASTTNTQEIQEESDKIKKEYEKRFIEMQAKIENEQISKQKLEEEVTKLQHDLANTLKTTSSKVDGFGDDKAEEILTEFQNKMINGGMTYRIETQSAKELVKAAKPDSATSPSKESLKKPSSRSSSPSLIKEYAVKGLGKLRDKLSGSQQNLSVSISKDGSSFNNVDIHQSAEQQVATTNNKGVVGMVAAHIQEEAVKRLNTLQEQLVGTKKDAEKLTELKKKHKKRKEYANERQKKLLKEIKKWEGEGIMAKVYDNLQDEIKTKNEQNENLQTELKSANIEINDLQSEFESDRVDYLDTIRKLEQQLVLHQQILKKVQPIIRKDCNYSNIDKIKLNLEFDEDSLTWNIPEIKIERMSLPKTGPGKENLATLKQSGNTITQESLNDSHGQESDKYAALLHRSSNDDLPNTYFKSKRAEQLLTSRSPLNNNSVGKLQPITPPITTSNSNTNIAGLLEPNRRPQKLEALQINTFDEKEKGKKKKKKNINNNNNAT